MIVSQWKSIIDQFVDRKIAVIGDLMVDAYIWGNASRLSPEAPVPIVDITQRDERLGGAANVAKNLRTLGAQTTLIGLIGKDQAGATIHTLTEKEKINLQAFTSTEKPTTVKTRIIAQDQHLLRVDEESVDPLNDSETTDYIRFILHALEKEKPEVVILEDYDKGALSPTIIQAVISFCKKHDIKTCVDPKKRHFLSYNDVTLFKPNLKEMEEGLNIQLDPASSSSLKQGDALLREKLHHQHSLLTLSQYGVFYASPEKCGSFPAFQRKIMDVSGAGDTVISVAALALASGCSMPDIAWISNLAGGLVCEYVGVVSIEASWLLKACEHELEA